MEWYGSIENRLEEGRQFTNEIKVGDGVTEYYWSDRHPYEVVGVKDQKHISIRAYDVKPAGRAYENNWELISNENNPVTNLTKRGKHWYITSTATIEDLIRYESQDCEHNFAMWFASNHFDKDMIRKNGKQTRYHKMNISIGKASYYYDYSF